MQNKINNNSYINTMNAFQKFYKTPLTEDDAIEIKNNLIGVLTILSKNKQKISQ